MTATATAPKIVKDTRLLIHKLHEDEIKDMTHNLTEQMLQIEKLQLEKKDVAKEYKQQIDRLSEQNSRLAEWLNTGEREQNIAVEIKMNYPKPGIKTIVRMDSYDSWEEPMVESENILNNLPGVTEEE